LRDAFASDARRIVEDLFNDRQLVPDDMPPLPGEIVHKDRAIAVKTLFGPITLKRRYLHHPNSNTGRAPLDLILDLVEQHTPAVAKLICRASALSESFHESAATLNAFTGLNLEERSHHRLVNRLAPDLRDALASLPPTIATAPIPIFYIENDGTGVPGRREELAGRKGKQPDGTARTREAKLGCVFTQTVTDEDGDPLRDPDTTSYVGTMGDCRESGALLRAEAIRRGLGLARALFGEGSFGVEQQSAWASELKRGDAAAIIDQTSRLLQTLPDIGMERLEVAQREIAYFITHRERTRYGYFRSQGYFIGSGVIEAGCKTVIGRRLKQSGMFWGERGAENILQLRCLLKSPHFEAAWQARHPLLTAQQAKARHWKAS
jgi:hypothetical protein